MPKQTTKLKENKSAWRQHPEYQIDIKPCEKSIRVIYNGETIADSQRSLLLQEQGHAPVYYFPPEDVRRDLFRTSDKTTFCPFKGEASHWSLSVGDRHVAVAAWSYEEPFDEVKKIKGYFAFYPEAGNLIS